MSCSIDNEIVDGISKAYGSSKKLIRESLRNYNNMTDANKMRQQMDASSFIVQTVNKLGLKVNGENARLVRLQVADGVKLHVVTNKGEYKVIDDEYYGVASSLAVKIGDVYMNTDMIKTLYSDANMDEINKKDYSVEAVDVVNNPAKMMEIADKLEALEPTKDSTHKARLMSELNKLATTFSKAMPNVTVHLNESADRNKGIVEINDIADVANVYIGVGPGHSNMSPLEVYVHEMMHTAIDYVLSGKGARAASLRQEIVDIRTSFVNHPEVMDTLVKYMPNPNTAKEDAETLLEYITESEDNRGLKEFVVYARTNEAVMKAIEELSEKKVDKEKTKLKWSDKIANWLSKVFGELKRKSRGLESADDLTRMAWLTDRLIENNNKALYKANTNRFTKVLTAFSNYDEKVRNAIEKFKKSLGEGDSIILDRKGNVAKYRTAGYNIFLSLFDAEARKRLKLTAQFMGIKASSTFLAAPSRAIQGDEVEDAIDSQMMRNNALDMMRNDQEQWAITAISKLFSKKLNSEELDALNVVYDTDLVSLWKDYDLERLLDGDNVDRVIKDLENKLKSKYGEKDYNYYTFQADLLAKYVKNNEDHKLLLKNAESIARKLNDATKDIKTADKELASDIDKLASLYALSLVTKGRRQSLKKLLKDEPAGVTGFMTYIEREQKESKKELFGNGTDLQYIKGYRVDVYPENMDMKIAPVSEEKALRRQGYKLVSVSDKHPMTGGQVQGMYINTMPVRTTLHKGAMRFKNTQGRGSSVMKSYLGNDATSIALKKGEVDVIKLKKSSVKDLEAVYNGTYKTKKEDTLLSPRFDTNGKIVDYTYGMSNSAKNKYLGREAHPLKVLGRTRASNFDKTAAREQNKLVAEVLRKDAEENTKNLIKSYKRVGKNTEYYVWFGDGASDPEHAELWSMLSEEIKEELAGPVEPGQPRGIFVRTGLMDSAIGYRDFNLTDTKAGKKLPEVWRYNLKIAGSIWDEIVRMFKQNILLKIPQVLMANVTSNFALSMMYFKNPATVAKYQIDAVKQLNALLKDVRELSHLETLANVYGTEDGGTSNEKMYSKNDIRKLRDLRARVEQNPAKKLVDVGFFTKMLEEVETSEETGNILKDLANKKLKGVPSVVRNGLDWVWMSDSNPFVKAMDMATQYSDFVARYAHYNIMVDEGKDPKVALTQVKTMFVNYQAPTGRGLEWANKKGLIMFSKYFLGIQRAIFHLATGHPLKFLVAVIGQASLLDIPDITDSSIVAKDMGTLFYSPIETLVGGLTPGAIVVARELM